MKRAIYQLIVITLFSIFTCCQTTSKLIYGTNKSITYASKNNYLNENFQNKTIDTTKVVFLQNEAYNQLAYEIVSKKLSVYYGISGEYFISSDQMNMQSCSGQFETLYTKAESDDSELQKTEIIDNPILKNLALNPNKKTAIFIYSYKFGRLNNTKVFDIIKKLENDDNFDYRLLSLDNFDIKS